MKTGKCGRCGAEIAFLIDGKGFVPVLWESLQSVDKRNYSEMGKVVYSEKRGHIKHKCEAGKSNGNDNSNNQHGRG